MKKNVLPLILLICVLALSGCMDNRYLAERRMWHAEREVAGIIQASSGKLSPEEVKHVSDIYDEVAKAYPLEPVAANIHFLMARIYLSQGKPDLARKELSRVVQNFSSNTQFATRAYFGIGNIYEGEGKWPQAKEQYETIMDLYPLSTLGLSVPMYLVQHYQRLSDAAGVQTAYEKAIKLYDGLIEKYTQTSVEPVIRDHLASLHILVGHPDRAIDLWDETISNYSEGMVLVKAYLSKAGVYEQQMKDLPAAIAVYQEILEKFPKVEIAKNVQYRVARLHLANDDLKKAKKEFEEIIAQYPQDEQLVVSSYAGLAQCYRKETNTEKVIEMYNAIAKKYPRSAAGIAIPFLTAQYYQDIKYAGKAETSFQDAIATYENMLESKTRSEKERDAAMHFLALSYLKNYQWDEAMPLLRQLIERHPNNPSYLIDIAAVHRKLQNAEAAINIYEELLKRYPQNAFVVKFARSQIDILKQELAE